MLGRSIGIEEEKLRHLGDDPLPDGVYSDAEATIIRYAQTSTRMLSIDETTYQALARHFSVPQLTRAKPCPYKKDDNAHIEQKNWIHVRKLLGFDGRPVGPGEMDTEISPGYEVR